MYLINIIFNRFGQCRTKNYHFVLESVVSSDDDEFGSLASVTKYNLHSQNHPAGYVVQVVEEEEDLKLTNATQPEFVH
jgi:hypothetical protein